MTRRRIAGAVLVVALTFLFFGVLVSPWCLVPAFVLCWIGGAIDEPRYPA